MFSILKKEIASFFNSLIGYIVIAVFLIMTGLMMWIYPDSNILDYGYAEMDSFFRFCPYIFLFLIPAITMRMFAEEFKTGTIELLFTKPVSLLNIILSKFLASLIIVIVALVPTLIYYFSIYQMGNPVGNIDSASVFSSYVGLLFLAGCYVALGIFTSTLSKNQVVAFILSAVLCYFFYDGLANLAAIFRGDLQYYLNYLALNYHYDALGKGLVDSRNIIYMLSFTAILLYFTQLALIKKRG